MICLSPFTPASIWRAFFVFVALSSTAVAASKGPSAPPELAQVGMPAAEEAAAILEQFRQSGVRGEYFFQFELHALPRRGAKVVYRGRMWGGRNEMGAINRVELTDAAAQVHRLLVQNGEKSAVWRLSPGGKVEQISASALFEPLIPGVEITAFDLQQPFLYWPGAVLERIARIRGRPAHAYSFKAPPDFAARAPVTGARAYLDTQFNALMQVELLGPSNRVVKTTALVDIKKIVDPQTKEEQWLPKSFDVRNELTRDKTRFVVIAAAIRLELAPAVFEPSALTENIASPAAGKLVRLDR